jgi:MFS transporter (putative signal transducer)
MSRPETSEARPGLRASLGNRTLMHGLAFMVIYQCGIRLGASMTGPFLVDAGISVAAIGWIKGAGGAVAGILAALVGAAITQRFGTGRALAGFALLNIVAGLGLAAYALGGLQSSTVMIGLLLLQGVATAMSFVALYAAMMNWCSPRQVATDFALLQSIDALIAVAMGMLAGTLGQQFGYAAIFGVAVLLLAFAALRSLRLDRLGAGSQDHSLPASIQESIR